MSFENQVLESIEGIMPADAEIQTVPGTGSLNVVVSWKLNDDAERPNKMSKTISISVTHEAARDFTSASASDQGAAHQRVANFLMAKLSQFDPLHNTPKYEAPPVEQWLINSAVVLG